MFDDINKVKRKEMWWAFVISLLSITGLKIFDGRQFSDTDFATINDLILSEDSYYNSGGAKGSPSVVLQTTTTNRSLIINYEEYACVKNKIILDSFKEGDTISIKISKEGIYDFYSTSTFGKFAKLYGLAKDGKEYISLACRNKIATTRTRAAIVASISTAMLSLIFAVFLLRPKTKYEAHGKLPISPILIVTLAWLTICFMLR